MTARIPLTMTPIAPPDRCAKGYTMAPKERALAVQFLFIAHDFPPESKQSLREAIVEALDEAFLAGVAAAQRAKETV